MKKNETLVNEEKTTGIATILVELKVSPAIDSRDEAQLLNELKATGIKIGLLLNFGKQKAEFKRFVF